MLNKFLFTNIEKEDIGNIWFQQDDFTCHTAEAILDVMRPVFEDRIISRRADDKKRNFRKYSVVFLSILEKKNILRTLYFLKRNITGGGRRSLVGNVLAC